MKVSLRWLQEYIDLPTTDPAELSVVFTNLGHEVEGVETLEPDWTGVVVGKVLEVGPHPDADRIRVCQVDIGGGPTRIICGAWNFDAGAFVPVAVPGAVLPGGFEIGERTIRGVTSHGMICSERELGLGEDHAGILVLDGEEELGRPFAELVELPDVVFDLAIGPNRPDAMSMVGLARDLAAHYDIDFRLPADDLPTVPGDTGLTVAIEDPEGCRRFVAREIRGVTIRTSPMWMRHRLAKAGMRPISNVVDVTNYVMLELGHPLHAFDADTIAGGSLIVKRATDGETLVTLDGEERRLTPDDLIIYDADGPTSMSGTMGGERSEVGDGTTRVIMEAASWDPPTIMYMSRRHGLRSEASLRFERGVDPELADRANRRASALVASLGGGEVLEGFVDEVAASWEPAVVDLRMADVDRLLGPGLDAGTVADILGRLGLTVEPGDPMRVVVPTFRPDLTRPADLVEEVARIHGYDRFEARIPTGPAGGLEPRQKRMRRVTEVLASAGLFQALSLPFVGLADLERLGVTETDLLTVKNPLRDEESKLRPTMLPGLLSALRRNLSHGASGVHLFETGRVFSVEPDVDDPRLPTQPMRLAWVMHGPFGMTVDGKGGVQADGRVSLAVWRRLAGALGIEARLLPGSAPGFHPGRTAAVEIDGVVIGHVGELHPEATRAWEISGRVGIAELDYEPLLAPVAPVPGFTPSVYPHVDFDLSFRVAPDALAGELLRVTSDAGGDLLESSWVFDEFRGPDGERAIAIRYRLRAPDRTLTGEDMAAVRQAMIDAAAAAGATLRGA
ncbi:MAG TPA: phenylalanine--tRNA ligase subunit beta [Acidimicrobiia bacterium]|nr:phenylalanine--tRNA ligase subunit beta [Acidimicrobiia bacterium]